MIKSEQKNYIIYVVLIMAMVWFPGSKVEAALRDVQLADNANPKMTIALDPGHGGEENGAYYYGIKEKEANYQIAKMVKEELERYPNIDVVITREVDEKLGLQQRVERASQQKADLFVSLHLNASGSHKASGATIYVTTKEGTRQKMQDLADLFLGEFENIGLRNNGTIARMTQLGARRRDGTFDDYYGVLRHASNYGIPGLLVEHCFMDREADLPYVKTVDGLHKLAKADANAIAAYYGFVDATGKKATVRHAQKYGFTTKGLQLHSEKPPKVCGIQLINYEGSSPGIATYEVEVEDSVGLTSLYFVYKDGNGNTFTTTALFEGMLNSGLHNVECYIPAFLIKGNWVLTYVGAGNAAGYENGYNRAGSQLIGFGKCQWTNTFDYFGEADLVVSQEDSISTVKAKWLEEEIKAGHRKSGYRYPAIVFPN